ncbi:MAG: thiol-disulfide oxidoreductase DCC family protein [Sphingobacteriia bacterium]|jgi:predicted DCC family thiol-disulfide oxidoreductase YuxK
MSYEIQEVEKHSIILFDGVCNLCSSSVQFVIKHDPQHHFRFASLQSDFGQQKLAHFNLSTIAFNSFVLLENGKMYTESTAALKVAKQLNKGWSLLYAFIIVPAFIRNAVYQFIAKNRYKWFGKKETCWIPTPALQHLFFD